MEETKPNSDNKYSKKVRTFAFIAIVLAFLILIFIAAGEFLAVDAKIIPADVIVVLSGNDDLRLKAAAKLYQDGYSDSILLTNTGRTYSELNIPYTQHQIDILRSLDIPEGAVFLTDFISKNTGQEATGIIEKMFELQANSLIIVTDAWHTRRVKIIYSDTFANTGFDVQYYGAANPNFHPKLWWLSWQGWKDVVGEYVRIIGYFIKRDTNIPDYPVLDFFKDRFLN